MPNIIHEILARYLDSDQYAFETTPRELWPSEQRPATPQDTDTDRAVDQWASEGGFGEPEPQS